MKVNFKSALVLVVMLAALEGHASVVPIDGAGSMFAGVSPITFSEVALGTTNPTIGTVSFGSFFVGQSLGELSTCPMNPPICVLGSPIGSLSLAASPAGLGATIVNDPAHASSPVLAGSWDLTRGYPIAMLFADDVSAVSVLAGAFNGVGTTSFQAFSRAGDILASGVNTQQGLVTFGFGSTDANGNAQNAIAGLLISGVGVEDGGFTIDNVRTIVTPSDGGGRGQVPEPPSYGLVVLAGLGLWTVRSAKGWLMAIGAGRQG